MSLALIAALPFLGALLPGLLRPFGRGAVAAGVGAVCLLALAGLLGHAPAVLAGGVVQARYDWLPGLGLNATFRLDGLGLLFAGMILGIGALIILYARYYLEQGEKAALFYTYLMLFQGAMLGIVLSDNLLLLLIFWELTSLSSFLLIGFWQHLAEGRQGARMALVVTGAGGLALIAGVLILGRIAGSYDLSVILTAREAVQADPLYRTALVLILLGCFTKSAQVPFHFWLPHAMAAPTPVSAYLHSATMVKAGIYLMARLWPVLAGPPEWFWIVSVTGLITMLLGAAVALFRDDLKAVLAYSTVSHLGLITMLLGFGTKAAAVAAVVHILAHASFKAALFLCAGIIDHATHTRDLRLLGGLRRLMPLTFGLVLVASLSMAGVPPFSGFLSKELMLDQAAQTGWFGAVATASAALTVAYSLRLIAGPFLGAQRGLYSGVPHDPAPGLWLAPAALVLLVVLGGLIPMALAAGLVTAAASAIAGQPVEVHLTLWHGLDAPALWLSLAAIGGGIALHAALPALRPAWHRAPLPQAKRLFDGTVNRATRAARAATAALHEARLSRAVAVTVLTITGLAAYAFATGPHAPGTRALTAVAPAPAILWAILMAATLAVAGRHRNRLLALLLTSMVGLVISVGFAYFSAPDLAITQITVEVVTLILMLLALNFLPRTSPVDSTPARRGRDAVVAGLAGFGAGGLAYALMLRDFAFPSIAAFHLEQSKPGAGGTNAVNTIIVDFRGYDTYGEITVLGIAALVICALTDAILRDPAATARLRADHRASPDAGDRHPQLMVVVTRLLLPMAMMVGVYIYLRGHNLPGGGFVAGLVVAIALVLQYIASGFVWSQQRLRITPHALIGAGVLTASACGAGAWAFGLPFLTSGYDYFALGPLEPVELATAAIFDLGVFLCVLGAVLLALSSFARLGQRAGDVANTAAMAIDRSGRGGRS